MIAALVGVAIIGGVALLGGNLNFLFEEVSESVSSTSPDGTDEPDGT